MVTVALAGKPNAGKSTFFSAATAADVEIANYPFTTIDANRGVSAVRTTCPCTERDRRCDADRCRNGKRYVPVELVDVAGLVPGAHEGRGLGNQFLDALSDADVIVTVVDAAGGTNEEGEPVEVGTADPVEEVSFIEEEMEAWLAGIIDRNWEQVERGSRAPDFDLEVALNDVLSGVGAGPADVTALLREREFPENPRAWSDGDRQALASGVRERTKPMLVAANKVDIAPPDFIDSLLELDRPVVPTTAEGEQALQRAADASVVRYDPGDSTFDVIGDLSAEQQVGLDRIGSIMTAHDGTGVQRALNRAVFELLDKISVYPVENETHWTDSDGTMLPDAFLLDDGSTPRDLAASVHTDIADGYLHAVDARSKRRISDDHELEEGDVIKIVSTAS